MTRIAGYLCLTAAEPEPDLLDRMAASFNLPGAQSISVREDAFGLVLVDRPVTPERLRERMLEENGTVIALDGRDAGPLAARRWLDDPLGFVPSTRGDILAGVRFDRKRRTLAFFRDRFGVRTFYYAVADGVLLFASEIKALLSYPASFELDREMLGRYLSMNYRMWFGRDQTFFEQIRELQVASYATVDAEGIRVHRYWSPPDSVLPDTVENDSYVSLYRRGLERSVAAHLERTRQPLFLVSGGLDSPVIAAQAAALVGRVDCCAAIFPGHANFDESRYVDVLTGAIGGKVFLQDLGPTEFLEVYDDVIERHDQPLLSPTYVLLFRLLQFAEENGYDAVFGGGGGDFVSQGCLEYNPYLLADYAAFGRAEFDAQVERWCERVGPFLRYWPGEPARLKALISTVVDFEQPGFIRNNPDWVRADRTGFGEALAGVELREPPVGVRYHTYRQSRVAEDMLFQAVATHFVEDLNVATFGVPLCEPFWDLELVEFGFQLPIRTLFRDGWTKAIVREATAGLLPDELRLRPEKTGLGVPVGEWFRSGPLSDAFRETLRSPFLQDSGLIDVDTVAAAHQRLCEGEAGYADLVWKIFALTRWAERWL